MTPEQLLDAADLDALRQGSPLHRCPPAELLRNALSVLVHRGDRGALPAIERLAREHPEPWLRDHARWAADALGGALPPAGIV
jgi:epoxyqueuosine reductase QueG